MTTQALVKVEEERMKGLITIASKNFGFAMDGNGIPRALTANDLVVLAKYCIAYGFDPIKGEVILFQGKPTPMIDAIRRKAQETREYLGCKFRPIFEDKEKVAMGYDPADIVVECTVRRLIAGQIAEFSHYGGVRKKEIDAVSQKGGARHPVLRNYPSEMAQNRAEKHALRTAFQFTFPGIERDTPSEPDKDALDGEFKVIEEPPEQAEDKGSVTETPQVKAPTPEKQAEEQRPASPPPACGEMKSKVSADEWKNFLKHSQLTKQEEISGLLGIPDMKHWHGTIREAVDKIFAIRLTKGLYPSYIASPDQLFGKEYPQPPEAPKAEEVQTALPV